MSLHLTTRDLHCLLDALCCVCSADGSLSPSELTAILNALKGLGVHVNESEIRAIIVNRCRQVFKGGVRQSAEAVITAIRASRNPQLAELVCRAQAKAIAADGRVANSESEIRRLFLEAFGNKPKEAETSDGGSPKWIWVLTGGTFVFLAGLLLLGVRDSTRHAQRMRIEAANREIRTIVDQANAWVHDGRLADADHVEQLLMDASHSTEADNLELVGPALSAVREAKGRLQLITLFASTEKAIAAKRFAHAQGLLNECMAHKSATAQEVARAESLIAEITLATSDSAALRALLAMEEAAFAEAARSGVFDHAGLTDPILVEVHTATLVKQVPEATRQREDIRRTREAERATAAKERSPGPPTEVLPPTAKESGLPGIAWGSSPTNEMTFVERTQSGEEVYQLKGERFRFCRNTVDYVRCHYMDESLRIVALYFHQQAGLLDELRAVFGAPSEFSGYVGSNREGLATWEPEKCGVMFLGQEMGGAVVMITKADSQEEAQWQAEQVRKSREHLATQDAFQQSQRLRSSDKKTWSESWAGLQGIDWGSAPTIDMTLEMRVRDREFFVLAAENKKFGTHEASLIRYVYKDKKLIGVRVEFRDKRGLLDELKKLMGPPLSSGERAAAWASRRFGACMYSETDRLDAGYQADLAFVPPDPD